MQTLRTFTRDAGVQRKVMCFPYMQPYRTTSARSGTSAIVCKVCRRQQGTSPDVQVGHWQARGHRYF